MAKYKVGEIAVAEPWDKNLVNPVRNTQHEYLKFINSAVFSEDARHFLRYGNYTTAPYGSKDWTDFWDEREKRCIEGYSVGGVRVSGRHYFFLNFSMLKARPVDPITGLESDNKKIITFPRFLDHQYYLFLEIEECFAEGPHVGKSMQGLIIAKSRRKGISFVNSGGIIAYNYNFIKASLTTIAAYEAVHYNTLLNGTHFVLNHLNRNTDWSKRRQRVNRRDHFRSSFVYTDKSGLELEGGFMSEVQAKSFKDDPFKAIGDSTYTMCFEEAGRFKGLLDAYTIAEPTFRDGDIMTGVPMIWGTGGDVEAGGRDLEEMFYNPKAYGLKSYSNIYDENAVGDCGWFIDDLWYKPGLDITHTYPLVDKEGNSYRDLTKVIHQRERDTRATGSRVAFRKHTTQYPLSPKEAFLRVDSSPFDTLRAQSRLTNILTDQKTYINSIYTARFVIESDSGEVKYEYDPTSIPLREFPIKDWEHVEGCPEIYEHPHRNNNGDIQPFRYIAGIDSYDADKSTTDSVGSFILLDRLTDRIVCHYKGRPLANKFYETCRRILKYYNATANYERSNKGIYGHFYNMKCIHMLCDEPDILKEKGISKANTIGNNAHPYSEFVYTPTGKKSWESIKVGSTLFNEFGGVTKVVDIPYDGYTDVYEIELFDGRKIKASSEHNWNVIWYNNKIRTCTTLELLHSYKKNKLHKNGNTYDRRQLKIPTPKAVEYTLKKVELDPYTLGLLLGDGSFTGRFYNTAKFTSSKEDLEEYKKLVPYKFTIPSDDRHMYIKIPNIGKISKNLKLHNTVSNTKFIPNTYKYNSKEIRLEVLKGLIDTDGTIDINGTVGYSTTSKNLCEDVLFIARSLGYNATSWKSKAGYKDKNRQYVPCKDAYTIVIWTHDHLCKLQRKIEKQSNSKSTRLLSRESGITIKNIKHVGKEQCKCVTVDNESGCYLINELVVTHNSKGTAPSTAVNAWGRELSALWTETPAYGEDAESEIINMDKIRSIGILREILSYNDEGNFDDISALGMLMIYRENIATTRIVKESQKRNIVADPFWTRNTPGLQHIANQMQNKFR